MILKSNLIRFCASRGCSLQGQIDKLAVKVTQLDSNMEEVTLEEIQLRKAFRSSQTFDQQVVSREMMPKSKQEQYMAIAISSLHWKISISTRGEVRG